MIALFAQLTSLVCTSKGVDGRCSRPRIVPIDGVTMGTHYYQEPLSAEFSDKDHLIQHTPRRPFGVMDPNHLPQW